MTAPLPPHNPARVKQLTERLVCPVHNEHAKVEITEQDGFVISEFCCEEFKELVSQEFDNILSDNIGETIQYLVQGKP